MFSRRTQRWNQSPKLDVVIDTIQRYSDKKVIVLTNNNAQIDRIEELLASSDGIAADQIYTVYGADSSTEQRDTVDAFDEPGEPGVLIGTGDLIGEGVDMQHADVGINMSTGSVNKELIQRIGRVLRNTDGNKQATFINLVGTPVEREAQILGEDGHKLIEEAQQFVVFGERFDNAPIFAAPSQNVSDAVGRLLDAGHEQITTLDDDGVYDWPDEAHQEKQLESLIVDIETELESGTDAVLQGWSPTPAESDRTNPTATQVTSIPGQSEAPEGTGQSDDVVFAVHNSEGDTVSNAFVSIVTDDDATCGRTDKAGQLQIDTSFASYAVAVRHPSEGVATLALDSLADGSRQTITLSATRSK